MKWGDEARDQTAQFLMFMDMLMKNPNEVAARTFLGGAVHSCQHNGKMGDELAMLVFQKVFPEEELPAVLSSEIFETLSVRQQDK
uniref:hypothetical protein n=1 Tax=Halomonas sp. TaxID=1486246 RepID=UPI0026272406|nr:hypothetical protein [Halomonas sp.]